MRAGAKWHAEGTQALIGDLGEDVFPGWLFGSVGGANETRTRDPLLAKQVLFQLSYSPMAAWAALSGYLRLRARVGGGAFPGRRTGRPGPGMLR